MAKKKSKTAELDETTDGLQAFCFPEYGIVIRAESQEKALALLPNFIK